MALIKANNNTISGITELPTGISGQNYPAFHAYLSSSTSPADNVATKTACDTELFDSDNCYDNSTNYRFTPTVAGKYFVYTRGRCSASSTTNLVNSYFMIFKNGSEIFRTDNNFNGNQIVVDSPATEGIVDMNGTTDYIESFHRINTGNGSGMSLTGNANYGRTYFGAYRIGD